ncbi:MAG TPA: hypothetical protein VEU33_01375 [Archangium sp.]|nr:hypothetical protein [Archangium sp.]
MSKLLPFLLALLCACQTPETSPGSFQILEITPREQLTNETTSVIVRLDLDPLFLVDYGNQSVRMLENPVLELGSQLVVPLDTYLGHGQFQGTVGAGLGIGLHEVRVKLGDGREATFTGAFEVRNPSEQPVLGYWFDSIPNQYVNEPFPVVIHAEGPNAEHFEGRVTVQLYRGGLPTGISMRTSRFSRGIGTQELTIDTPGNYIIVVQDDQGHNATSNAFDVLQKN